MTSALHRIVFSMIVLATLAGVAPHARALEMPQDIPQVPLPDILPSIGDPFSTQKKLAPYGRNLKPASCPPLPDTAKPLALSDVVVSTICHNPDARAAYISLLSSADSYDGSIMSYLPDPTASASASSSKTFVTNTQTISRSSSVSASASMVLYDFGRRETTLQIAERTLAAAGLGYDSSLQGFIATSLQAYFTQLTTQNALDIAEKSMALAKASLDATEVRYELGLTPLSDALQARTRYAQTQLDLERSKNALTQSAARLAQLMGFAPMTELSVAELDDSNILLPPFKAGLVDLIEKAKAQRVDRKSRQLQLKNAEDSLRNTQRRHLPSITASAGSSYGDWDLRNRNDNPRTDQIGVSVSIPIFTGFQNIFSTRSQVKQLEIQKLQYEDAERTLEQDVLTAWNNYNTARASYDISVSSLSNARLLNDVAIGRYREGLSAVLDLLSAQDSYRSALQNHLSARYNLLTARVDLIRAVGELDLTNVEPQAAELPPLAAVVTYQDPTYQRNQP